MHNGCYFKIQSKLNQNMTGLVNVFHIFLEIQMKQGNICLSFLKKFTPKW